MNEVILTEHVFNAWRFGMLVIGILIGVFAYRTWLECQE